MLPLQPPRDDSTVATVQSVLSQLKGLWYARLGIARGNLRNADYLSSVLTSRAQDGIAEETLAALTRPLRDIQNLLITQQELHTGCLGRLAVSVS